jgi:hypothetical protein
MSIVDRCVLLVCSGAAGRYGRRRDRMDGTGRDMADGSSGWFNRADGGTAERTSGCEGHGRGGRGAARRYRLV